MGYILTLKTKPPCWGMLYLFRYETSREFLNMDLRWATSMESSRRDLSNDMAERRPILKNNQNRYHPCFGFTPKTGIALFTQDFLFTVFTSYFPYRGLHYTVRTNNRAFDLIYVNLVQGNLLLSNAEGRISRGWKCLLWNLLFTKHSKVGWQLGARSGTS